MPLPAAAPAAAPAPPPHSWRADPRLPWAVLALSLLLTLVATLAGLAEARARRQARFEAAALSVASRIEVRLQGHIALLQGVKGLFSGSTDVTREEFRVYLEQLQVERRYPGLQGVGYSPLVPPGQEVAFVARAHAEGLRDFRLWPEPGPPGRPRFTILFLEPLDARNAAALGFDMSSEPVRAQAMALARDSGAPALSGRVELKQEIGPDKQPGFLLYLPLYAGGREPRLTERRRARLSGYVYAPFRAGDFFGHLLADVGPSPVGFEVYDGPRVDPAALLHASHPGAPREPGYAQLRTLWHAGRTWTLAFHARPGFVTVGERVVRPALGLLGVVVSFALFALARAQGREHARQQEALRRAGFAQQLIGIVSHDLRTPLSAIAMSASTLQAAPDLDERQRRALARIQSSTGRANQMIEALLDFTRARLGSGIPVHPRAADLHEVARRAVDEAQAAHPGRRVELSCAGALQGEWDPERLEQVLGNLLGNALRYGDPEAPVQVRCEGAAEGVRLQVHNAGAPIAPAQQAALFEPFRQGEHAASAKGGLGLGLFIVAEIVRSHGGHVEVASSAQAGTTFTVHLPRRSAAGA